MLLSSPQAARKIHSSKFRAGKVRLLVVTDGAARGIDIPLLDNVVNYGGWGYGWAGGRVGGRRGSACLHLLCEAGCSPHAPRAVK